MASVPSVAGRACSCDDLMPTPFDKLTPERKETIVSSLRAGATMQTAAHRARIHPRTLSKWVERGERELASVGADAEPVEGELPYVELFLDLKQALADFELQCFARVQTSKPGEWQRAAWVLERRFGFVAAQKQDITFHEEPRADPVQLFGTTDPDEAAKRARAMLWDRP